jgi:hypothetical protein
MIQRPVLSDPWLRVLGRKKRGKELYVLGFMSQRSHTPYGVQPLDGRGADTATKFCVFFVSKIKLEILSFTENPDLFHRLYRALSL